MGHMETKDWTRFGFALLTSLVMINMGLLGIRYNPSIINVVGATVFILGGIYLITRIFRRAWYRLRDKS